MDLRKCVNASDKILHHYAPAAYEGEQRAFRELQRDEDTRLPLNARIRQTLLLIRALIPDYPDQFRMQGVESDELDEFYTIYTTAVDAPEDDAPEDADIDPDKEYDQPPDDYYDNEDWGDENGDSLDTTSSAPANPEPTLEKQEKPQPPQPEAPPAPTHPDHDSDDLDDLFGFDP